MKWVRIILFGLLMLFVQTTVFNNLHTLGVCHPFVYVLFLICLPVMPRWAEQLFGFAMGVAMDCICSSPGIHTAACAMVSWLKPMLLARMVSVLLTVLHHLTVFALDAWSWSQWWWVLLEVVVSGAVTIGVLFVYGFLIHRS